MKQTQYTHMLASWTKCHAYTHSRKTYLHMEILMSLFWPSLKYVKFKEGIAIGSMILSIIVINLIGRLKMDPRPTLSIVMSDLG